MTEFTALVSAIPSGIPYAAIIAFALFALFRGLIVPGSTHKEALKHKDDEIQRLREDRDKRIAEISDERDDWKEAFNDLAEVNESLVTVNTETIEFARVAKHVLQSLPQPEIDKVHALLPMESGEPDDRTK